MAFVLMIPMRSKFSDRVARAEDARALGCGKRVQEAAAHGVTVGCAWRVVKLDGEPR
jgi:hypothetical protein